MPHEFQITDDVLIKDSNAVEFFEQVKGDVGLPVEDGAADFSQIIDHSQWLYIVPHFSEGRDDIIFRFPFANLIVRNAIEAFRRNKVFMDQDQHAQFFIQRPSRSLAESEGGDVPARLVAYIATL